MNLRQPKRILSVEDDATLQHLLSLALQNEGYEMHYAFTGQEGYEKALALNPDLILVDMMLPILTGPQMIMRLKSHRSAREIPIIVMTSYFEDARFFESSVRTLGIVEYLKKPIDLQELKSLLRRILSQSAAHPSPEPGLRKGAVRVDAALGAVWINDRLITTLPPKRFEVLRALLESPGPAPIDKLLAKIWGADPQHRNTLEKTVERLRRDLGPVEGARIRTTAEGYELIG